MQLVVGEVTVSLHVEVTMFTQVEHGLSRPDIALTAQCFVERFRPVMALRAPKADRWLRSGRWSGVGAVVTRYWPVLF